MPIQPILIEFEQLLNTVPAQLSAMPEQIFGEKIIPEKWSKKQILGHLIDSAVNNHHRFIRIQYESNVSIVYDQDQWNNLTHYNSVLSSELITLWTAYNRLLLHIIQNITPENLLKTGPDQDGQPYPLAMYVADYVVHLKHHLKQLLAD